MNSRLLALVLVALGAAGWNAQAQWGSIHGNNRSGGGEHAPSHGGGGGEHGTMHGGGGGEHRAPAPPVEHHEAPPMGHREPNRRVPPSHVEVNVHEPHHWDLDEERRHAYFWSGYHAGMPIVRLPLGFVTVQVGGVPYDYYDGVFYQPAQSGYVVVAPPPGAMVPVLPPGAEAIVAGPYTYYYAGGAFYVQQPQGFQVVPPPLGITVPYLPAGAAPVSVNGMLYYQANGAYFLPTMQNGITVYTTVQP